MFFEFGLQGIESFRVGLNHHRVALRDSGLSSSLEICASKRVIIARATPLNFLAEDKYPSIIRHFNDGTTTRIEDATSPVRNYPV